MEIEKIEKFIDAGYTKEEINALLSGAKPEEPKPEEPKPEEPKEQSAGDTTHDSSLEITATLQALTTTVRGLQDTVKAIQAANVKTAETTTPKTDEIKSIMDSFINTL